MPFYIAVEVRDSEKHGKGVFALQDAAVGSVYWSMFPLPGKDTVAPLGHNTTPNKCYTETEIIALETTLPADQFLSLLWGGYPIVPHNVFCELHDGGQFTNHSHTPNCGGDWSTALDAECGVVVRAIKVGDEITEDYGTFHDEALPWVSALMAKHAQARHAFEGSIPQIGMILPDCASTDAPPATIPA